MPAALNSKAMNASAPVRILVVDDDPALRDLLSDYLTANGFVVDAVNDGVEMLARLAQSMPDAIVLDLMLPGEDGLSLARGLRKTSDVPILMLSARGEEIDRVVGLGVGADDYLAKPFSPRELLARLRALLRRAACASAAAHCPDGGPPRSEPAPGIGRPDHLHNFGPFTLWTNTWRLFRDDVKLPPPAGTSRCCAFLSTPRPCAVRATPSWNASGLRARRVSTAAWTYGSRACAARSRPIQRMPPSSARCAARAICFTPPGAAA